MTTTTTDSPWGGGDEHRRIDGCGWTLHASGGSLDRIAYRGDVILRALRVVVRDHDWRTVPAVLDSVSQHDDVAGRATVVTLRAHHDELGVAAHWQATLRMEAGRLRFDLDFEADGPFDRNRVGIVALHSPDTAGSALSVAHPDGSVTSAVFPVDVAPHQPAVDIAGLAWSSVEHEAELRFAGDAFEMEDQRNWTDASFKTYSTPLALPFPVPVEAGDRVTQSAELTVAPRSGPPTTPRAPRRGLVATAATVPRILVGASTAPGRPATRPAWLDGVGVLVELDLREPGWPAMLARAEADAGPETLDVRLIATSPDLLHAAVAALRGLPVARLGVVDARTHMTTPILWRRLITEVQSKGIAAALVGGTRAHFAELNRNHGELPAGLAGVMFSITPQMHDLSTRQVVESLEMQRVVAGQAVRIAAGLPVDVGPVMLRARVNAVATSPVEPGPADIEMNGYGAELLAGATDPRQTTDEYATWLLASAIALSVPGVGSISFAEAWGPRGFGTVDGIAFPAAEPLGWLASLQGAVVVPVDAAEVPPGVFALAARGVDAADSVVILLANASSKACETGVLGSDVRLAPWGRARVVLGSVR